MNRIEFEPTIELQARATNHDEEKKERERESERTKRLLVPCARDLSFVCPSFVDVK